MKTKHEKSGRNLTDIESILVLMRDDKSYSIYQLAGFIEEAIKARPVEQLEPEGDVYVWMKAKVELPPVPGYYAVQDMDNPYGTVTTAEYEGKEISGDGWKLKYSWLKKISPPQQPRYGGDGLHEGPSGSPTPQQPSEEEIYKIIKYYVYADRCDDFHGRRKAAKAIAKLLNR